MGDYADEIYDLFVAGHLDEWDDHYWDEFFDRTYWRTKDGRVLHPAKGEMDEQHIRNAMQLIEDKKPLYYDWHDTPLYKAFQKGLQLHAEAAERAKNLNSRLNL